MKRVLALDTSTWWESVALVQQEGVDSPPEVVGEVGLRVDRSHAPQILVRVERLLADCGWSKSSVDAYVATRGPGSFTGIRVALGTVLGLGFASGRPCFGVGTLEALAQAHGPSPGRRLAVIGAGRGKLYAAEFDAASSPPVELRAPWVAEAGELLAAADPSTRIVPGPGTEADLRPSGAAGRSPRAIASAAGTLVLLRGADRDTHDPPVPLYVRRPDVRLPRTAR